MLYAWLNNDCSQIYIFFSAIVLHIFDNIFYENDTCLEFIGQRSQYFFFKLPNQNIFGLFLCILNATYVLLISSSANINTWILDIYQRCSITSQTDTWCVVSSFCTQMTDCLSSGEWLMFSGVSKLVFLALYCTPHMMTSCLFSRELVWSDRKNDCVLL